MLEDLSQLNPGGMDRLWIHAVSSSKLDGGIPAADDFLNRL
jgi:hypothetical protein